MRSSFSRVGLGRVARCVVFLDMLTLPMSRSKVAVLDTQRSIGRG